VKYNNSNFFRWIKKCNQYDLRQFVPFVVGNQVVGNQVVGNQVVENKPIAYLHKNNIDLLTQYSEIELFNSQLVFSKNITSFEQRTEVIKAITKDLHQHQKIKSWVGEQYDVAENFGEPVLFTIERAAATFFGVQKYGVHVNGYTIKDNKYYLWIAKRAIDKPTWPGKLDHIVAGGHATGMAIQTTLEKECQEEAGMSKELSQQAIAVSLVDYNIQVDNKLSRDTLFVYDIKLPENFNPVNTDGEVEEFYLLPIEEVLQIVNQTDDFKTNCNLVIIDFAIRHGFIQPDQKLYTQIVKGLRNNDLAELN